MTPEARRHRRRGTPISEGLGADLQALGTLLASHTRGLDDYLNRQASRIEQRQQTLLAEAPEILAEAQATLLPAAGDLDAMSAAELRDLCRSKQWRGWSRLRRPELLAFVKGKLAPELEAAPRPASLPADASRTERLLLLLLHHLGVPQEQVEAAWREGGLVP